MILQSFIFCDCDL